jgi:hypothetical protein
MNYDVITITTISLAQGATILAWAKRLKYKNNHDKT